MGYISDRIYVQMTEYFFRHSTQLNSEVFVFYHRLANADSLKSTPHHGGVAIQAKLYTTVTHCKRQTS